jgi:hypothetical protein
MLPIFIGEIPSMKMLVKKWQVFTDMRTYSAGFALAGLAALAAPACWAGLACFGAIVSSGYG